MNWGAEPPIPDPDDEAVEYGPPGHYLPQQSNRFFKCRRCGAHAGFRDSDGKARCKSCKTLLHEHFEKVVEGLPTIPDSPATEG